MRGGTAERERMTDLFYLADIRLCRTVGGNIYVLVIVLILFSSDRPESFL